VRGVNGMTTCPTRNVVEPRKSTGGRCRDNAPALPREGKGNEYAQASACPLRQGLGTDCQGLSKAERAELYLLDCRAL